jgi:hypothetical protein
MAHQQHEHSIDSSQSSTFPFEFQPRATETLSKTLSGDFGTTHGNMTFDMQDYYSIFSATASGPSNPTIHPRFLEPTGQQMPYRDVLGSFNTQNRDFYTLPEYLSPLESTFDIPSQSEHRLTTTSPAEAMSSCSTPSIRHHSDDENTTLGLSSPLQPASNVFSEFLGYALQDPIMERPINARADRIAKPVPQCHGADLSCDLWDGNRSVQDVYGPGRSTPGETTYSAISHVHYPPFGSGTPSVHYQQQHLEHRIYCQKCVLPHQDGPKSAQMPSSSLKIGRDSTDDFVNYTLKDREKLSEGVARSGSLKTSLRRKATAKEKKSQLVQSFLYAISRMDPNLDLETAHGLILNRQERHDIT